MKSSKEAAREKQRAKKFARAAETAALSQFTAILRNANNVEDIFTLLPAFKKYQRDGLDCTIEDARASSLSQADLKFCFDLTRSEMKEYYDKANFDDRGWDDKAKWRELTSDDARLLVARGSIAVASPSPSSNSEATCLMDIIGFVHYRFLLENEVVVCYVYELHIAPTARGRGLGKWLMQLVELASRKLNMSKVMCTCFKANERATSFYMKKLKYVEDETSPDKCPEEFVVDDPAFQHRILSKTFIASAVTSTGGGSQSSAAPAILN